MKMTIEMPMVSECSAVSCAYNKTGGCHARAITVGDDANPRCDTFFESQMHTTEKTNIAGVGACKVAECRHNVDFECIASGVEIGVSQNQVKCLTFESRAA